MKTIAMVVMIALTIVNSAGAQTQEWPAENGAVSAGRETGEPGEPDREREPADPAAPTCHRIRKGGPIAGIVVASVFWWLLPMSIPVWITQGKKLKRRKAEIYEQKLLGCP